MDGISMQQIHGESPEARDLPGRSLIHSSRSCCIRWKWIAVLILAATACVAAFVLARTPVVMPATTTTAAQIITSTSSEPFSPWCEGANVSTLSLPKAGWCFCLYGGRCISHFSCAGVALRECQLDACGEASLEITASTASFRNIRLDSDILSIPVEYFRDIKRLSDRCPEHASQLLEALLAAGRRVFVSTAVVLHSLNSNACTCIRTSLYHGFMCTPSSGLCHQKSCRAVRQLQPVHRQRYPRLLLHSTFWHLHADDKYVTEPEPGRLHFLCREHAPCSLRNGPLDGGVVGGAVPREDSISGRLTSG